MFVKIGDTQPVKVLESKELDLDPEETKKKLAEAKEEIQKAEDQLSHFN